MRVITSVLIAAVVVSGRSGSVRAQTNADTLSLAGRTSMFFGVGLTGARDVTVSGGQSTTHTSGQLASFGFSHWIRPQVAVEISMAVLNADEMVSGGRVYNNAIVPFLFGLSVSPEALALSTSVRPYVSLAAGPYVHTISEVAGGNAISSTETAAGARAAFGANWFVTRHFLLNAEGNYHAVGRFEHADATTSKVSGFGMSVGFGFAWGGQ